MDIELVKDWLRAKHTTLWLNWDITDPDGLELAATFWLDTLLDYEQFLMGE